MTSCRQLLSPRLPHHNRHYVQTVSSRKSFLPQVFLGEYLLDQSNEQSKYSTCFGPCCKHRAQGGHSLLGRTVTITLYFTGPSVTLLGFCPRLLLYMTMVKWTECQGKQASPKSQWERNNSVKDNLTPNNVDA